ncbi:MAG: protein translocase subunit SecF [Chloroflexaceae bacterium]|nr:protein translocase subunit SecF [Chloroflexaceae bacterium]
MKFSVVKQQKFWWTLSATLVIASIAAMAVSYLQLKAPLRPGLDFVGGTRLQLERNCEVADCTEPIDIGKVREVLTAQNLASSSLQLIGESKQTLSVRSQNLGVEERQSLQAALDEAVGPFDPQKTQIDSVGPTIGRELFAAGLLALIVSFFGIIVYLSIRFQFDYAFFAILALFHDALVTAGVFALLGLVAGVEVDSLFLVALLTIVGFSVNDTVVIYDRVRETLADSVGLSMEEIIDTAVNQTLGRSINTTLTTLLPLVAIFIFGGETLKYFALALIIGFILGAYSSIFVASTLLGWWRGRQEPQGVALAEAAETFPSESEMP